MCRRLKYKIDVPFGTSIYDNGWGMFIRMLEYKLENMGKAFA